MKTFFCNRTVDKSEMKRLIKWVLLNYGSQKATCLVDQLKTLGFHYATQAGISLGIDDLRIPPVKTSLLLNAESEIAANEARWARGQVTSVDRLKKALDVWNTTNDTLKNAVIDHFRETDVFNPVYMMAFSGARGNISQVRQLVGMRGLMADPQGQILDFPIRRNFREGLTVTEYMISCYGARKGLVDTALRTANSGYLTRRLVDVAQNVIIQHVDCQPSRGLTVRTQDPRFEDKVIGRVLFRDVVHEQTGQLLARKNTDISSFVAQKVCQADYIMVRSPLTCNFQSVCQLCYGWSLAQQKLVQLGEAVGVLAAQSIGEPGTQLTMRTFHTGGVFAGEATEKVYSPHAGKVEYFSTLRGHKVTTYYGETAFLSLSPVKLRIRRRHGYQSALLDFPSLTLLFARPGEYVNYYQSIAELSRVEWEATKATRQPRAPQPPKRQDSPIKQTLADYDGQIYQEVKGQVGQRYQYNDHPNRGSWLWDFETQQTHRLWNLAGQFQPVHALARGDTWTENCQRFQPSWQPSVKTQVQSKLFFGLQVLQDPDFRTLSGDISPHLLSSSNYPSPPFGLNWRIKQPKSSINHHTPVTKWGGAGKRKGHHTHLSYLVSTSMLEELGFQTGSSPLLSLGPRLHTYRFPPSTAVNLSDVKRWKVHSLGGQPVCLAETVPALGDFIGDRPVSHRSLHLQIQSSETTSPFQSQVKSRPMGGSGFESFYRHFSRVSDSRGTGGQRPLYQYQHEETCHLEGRQFLHRQQLTDRKCFGGVVRHLKRDSQLAYLKHTMCLAQGYFLSSVLFDFLSFEHTDGFWLEEGLQWVQTHVTCTLRDPKFFDLREYLDEAGSCDYLTQLLPNQTELMPIPFKYGVQWREVAREDGFSLMGADSQVDQCLQRQVGVASLASGGEYRLDHPGLVKQLSGLQEQEKLNEVLSYFALKKPKTRLPNLKYDDDPIPDLLPRLAGQGVDIFHDEVGGVSVYDLILGSISDTHESKLPTNVRIPDYPPLCLTPQVQSCVVIPAGQVQPRLGSLVRQDDPIGARIRLSMNGQVLVRRSGHLVFRRVQAYKVLAGCNMVLHVKHGMCVQANTPLLSIPSVESTAGDIVQGLPKVDELLEARETTVAGPNGQNMHQILSGVFGQYASLYGMRLGCDYSFHVIRQQLVDEVQAVYQSQGVYISDKHIEIIVRQMTGKVFIIDAGTTRLLPGDIVDFRRVERISTQCVNTRKQLQYRPILLGITRASLAAESFIAAASFQETKRVLARSALEGRLDWLMGLKENVILGRLIPAGTGFYF